MQSSSDSGTIHANPPAVLSNNVLEIVLGIRSMPVLS
jgi:hypothetical protein